MIFPGPRRVLETLERVQREHPYGASGRITRCARTETDALAVWTRLLSEEGAGLDGAVRTLTPLEERLVIFGAPGRLSEPRALRVLSRLFGLREPSRASPLAWECYLISNGDRGFAEQARAFAAGPKARRTWPEIAGSQEPLGRIAWLYSQATEPFVCWVAREDVGLVEREPVIRALKKLLLSRAHVTTTRQRERSATVSEWLEECFIDSERVAWFANYIIDTHRTAWRVDDPFVQLVVARFEVPQQNRPFWDSLPPSVIAAVELWLKNVELTRLLGDNEGPRIRFWREFLANMVRSTESKDGSAVFICFGTWFAVQFLDMGKATYMFPKRRLLSMQRLYESALYAAVRDGNHLGRYTHQGYWWQVGARNEVRRVLREHPE